MRRCNGLSLGQVPFSQRATLTDRVVFLEHQLRVCCGIAGGSSFRCRVEVSVQSQPSRESTVTTPPSPEGTNATYPVPALDTSLIIDLQRQSLHLETVLEQERYALG